MIVTTAVSSSGQPSKSVQVQLPLEGSKLGLTKVYRHDLIDELSRLVDHKAAPMWLPVRKQ